MTITVVVYQIIDSYDSPYNLYWTVGNFVHVRFNDSTLALTVEIRDASGDQAGTLIDSPVAGPSLYFGNGGVSLRLTADPLYKYCDGLDLKQIVVQNSFPYAHLATTGNAVECQIAPVCDLEFDNVYTTVDTTGLYNTDGEIQVSATGSNGEIRFGLSETFDYATASPSGLFTGLIAGDYTVYAKDPLGCTDFIDITVKVTQVYGVKYRLEFDDARNNTHTIDILQRAYSGAITEVCGGDNPFTLRYNLDLNNKYDSVIFSEVELQLFNEVDEQFIELFQGDDQEYKIQYYDKTSTLRWVGYIVQQFYTQSIVTATNFYCTVTASDNLAILQDDDYSDIDGNVLTGNSSHLYIIQTLLKKTGLNLNLRSYIELFENSMDATDTDDVLPQAFISNVIFYADDGTPNKSIEVLQKILKVYGAQLFQTNGIWNIRRVENSTGIIEYREFDFEGTYVGNGTTDTDLLLAGRAANGEANWRDASQGIQLLQNYGKITLVNDLGLDNNLIDSGSFEFQYLKKNASDVYFFEGWQILQGQAGLRYGLEQVDNGDSEGALYLDFDQTVVPGPDTQVYTKVIPVVNTGQITLKFEYQAIPTYNLPWIRLGYRVKATSGIYTKYLLVLNGSATFLDDTNGVDDWNDSGYINEIYVSSYASWQTFERSFLLPASADPWELELTFYFNDFNGYAISDTDHSELKAVTTSSRLQSVRRKYMLDTSDVSNPVIYDYLLEGSNGTDPESLPDTVEPDDYNSVTNTSKWKLKNTLRLGANGYTNKLLIDNVKISEKIYIFDPTTLLVDPPKTVEYENIPNKYNLNKFSDTFYLGDLPEEIQNGELVYNGWIKLSDGTATTSWTRKGLGEDKLLMGILLEDYTAQLQDQTKRLIGNVLSDDFISYLNSFTHEGSKFKIHGYSFDAKNVSYSLELLGIIVGENGEAPPAIVREHTNEFSNEFA